MDGVAGVTINGLNPNDSASYLWNNNETSPSITGLSAATYSVEVTVSNGCVLTDTIVVDVNSACNLNINFIRTHETDTNANDGSAIATVGGGSGNYEYFWSNNVSDTNAIYDLEPGFYTVTVTDVTNNCVSVDSVRIFSIEDPCLLVIQINSLGSTGAGETDGAATVLVAGGQPPYTYIWNTGSTSAQISNLSSGVYVVTVEDSEGCQDVQVTSLNVISVFELGDVSVTVNLFPHPTSDYLNLSLELEKDLNTNISVLDLQGRIVQAFGIVTFNGGNNNQILDVSKLSKGTYFIHLSTEQGTIQKAFMVK